MVSVLFSEPKIPQSVNADCIDVVNLCVSVLFSEPKIPQSTSAGRNDGTCEVSVLFSEPKIPQFIPALGGLRLVEGFQCSSASRKFLNRPPYSRSPQMREFQCSSASRKFLNRYSLQPRWWCASFQCSSASRKFLNQHRHKVVGIERKFQCSSASRKFLNRFPLRALKAVYERFSALQRAENSSISGGRRCDLLFRKFQCSSASRKFLNPFRNPAPAAAPGFQCSSASRKFLNLAVQYNNAVVPVVSVLFSEPKIPQYAPGCEERTAGKRFQCSSASRKFLNRTSRALSSSSRRVSVLFSEPKIPQFTGRRACIAPISCFSALQRAENSSMGWQQIVENPNLSFSALQRAENSSIVAITAATEAATAFQCSSASRKFLNFIRGVVTPPTSAVFQCSSASRKFLSFKPSRATR